MSAPSPRITIPEVLPLVRDYYAQPGNGAGGNFHIVLDDGNINRTHVVWCWNRAREARDWRGMALGFKLLRMTISQRKRLTRDYRYA